MLLELGGAGLYVSMGECNLQVISSWHCEREQGVCCVSCSTAECIMTYLPLYHASPEDSQKDTSAMTVWHLVARPAAQYSQAATQHRLNEYYQIQLLPSFCRMQPQLLSTSFVDDGVCGKCTDTWRIVL